jgi:two-component system, sensor histidine kinase PdtaS
VGLLDRGALERSDIRPADLEVLQHLVGEWTLVADLALSDVLLWLPTWNEAGFVVAAHVRPTTAATVVPEQIVGSFIARGRAHELEQSLAHGRPITRRDVAKPWHCLGPEAYPVKVDGRVIAIVERRPSASLRTAGRLEEVYLQIGEQLLQMLVRGEFPPANVVAEATGTTRVGDGLVRLDSEGIMIYASPNAVSALRRLGLTQDPLERSLEHTLQRLMQRHGPVDPVVLRVAAGRVAGQIDAEIDDVTILMRSVPLPDGAMVLLRDVTETRRRDRQLLTKDATIREIHHRVKNNLQTVAALLRLQGRRTSGAEAKGALAEAQIRISSIAVVHDLLATGGDGDVPFAEVVDRIIALVRDLAPAYGAADVSIQRTGQCGALAADVTTPLAMATTELVHNAVEHAKARRIDVALDRVDDAITVTVHDDGMGVSMPPPTDGLGLQIVESLITGELRGTFSLTGSPQGTTAIVGIRVR